MGDDEKVRNSGEGGDQVISDTIAEIFLIAVATHVSKRQDGN
jgi:hypothetical protein